MFEVAELGRSASKEEWDARVPALRKDLLQLQDDLQDVDFPVILLFAGVDAAGKSETVQLLNSWFDPRTLYMRAFDEPGEQARERPEYWRYWNALPPYGRIALFMSSWYSRPLIHRAVEGGRAEELETAIDDMLAFERTLANDGTVILKFWLHLGREAQAERLRTLEADPLQQWRVGERAWFHWQHYDQFADAAERMISRTSTAYAPWFVVEGQDERYRHLAVGEILRYMLGWRLGEWRRARKNAKKNKSKAAKAELVPRRLEASRLTILSRVDLSQSIESDAYDEELARHQGRLHQLQRRAREHGIPTILAFEGWDAAGKGGAIRRVVDALEARVVRVHSIAAPTPEENAHHYLWRFWQRLPGAGQVALFDRTWYGRVLVERIEGFATMEEWTRGFTEISRFEEQLVGHGTVLRKYFLHISPEEQARRFKAREKTPYKRYKLTQEDWRNRDRWNEYEFAVHDLVERTSTHLAPWILVAANDKKRARLTVLHDACEALDAALKECGP